MKAWLTLIAAALVAGLGWRLASNQSHPSHRTDETHESAPPPSTTTSDPTEVFQRAFWKRPTAEDRILHAERREWSGDDGVERWQWFLEVEPSRALAEHLFERNAFGLSKMSSPTTGLVDVPGWFPREPGTSAIYQDPQGGMILFRDGNRLFATGSGGGFVAGVRPTTQRASAGLAGNHGRLPNSHPPIPPDEP